MASKQTNPDPQAYLKHKIFESLLDLVGAGSVQERLKLAALGVRVLTAKDFGDLELGNRFERLIHTLKGRGCLNDEGKPNIADDEAERFAKQLLELFAKVSDPEVFEHLL